MYYGACRLLQGLQWRVLRLDKYKKIKIMKRGKNNE